MIRRAFVLAAASLTFVGLNLAGCASAPTPNPIASTARDSFYVKDATVDWQFDDKTNTDQAYLDGKADLTKRLAAAVADTFKASPAGSEPVRFVITVKSYFRLSGAQQILIGGADNVIADVHVVNLNDGKEIGVYSNIRGSRTPPAGLLGAAISAASHDDVVGIVSSSFAKDLRKHFDEQ